MLLAYKGALTYEDIVTRIPYKFVLELKEFIDETRAEEEKLLKETEKMSKAEQARSRILLPD